jgi:hypothetical protein
MDALVSGQAATAAFLEGSDVSLHRFGDEGSTQSSFETLGRVFANSSDVQLLKGIRKEVAQDALRRSWSFDRAPRLALIVLDGDEYAETRHEAALYLDDLLDDPEVKSLVLDQLSWTPLPSQATSIFDADSLSFSWIYLESSQW